MAGQLFTQRERVTVLSKDYWDMWYANARKGKPEGQSAWGKPAALMLEHITTAVGSLKGKNIADLAGGDGRYSVHFAKQGAIVDHVDYSEGARNGLLSLAQAHGARIEERGSVSRNEGGVIVVAPGELVLHFDESGGHVHVHTMDVRQYARKVLASTPWLFDLVFSSGLIEYLSPTEIGMIMERLKRQTKIGGAHAIVYLAKGPGVSEIHGEHPYEPGSVEKLYVGWRMSFTTNTGNPNTEIRDDTHVIVGAHDDHTVFESGVPTTHKHMIRRFIAIKTVGNE